MPDLTVIPLAQLLAHCRPLTMHLTAADEAAWYELLRRALLQRNDSAWDALVQRLWPIVLHWIYTYFPDTSPADAERVAQMAIWSFLQSTSVDDPPSSVLSASLSASNPSAASTHIPIASQFHHILQQLLARS